jgi:hypothetical protein
VKEYMRALLINDISVIFIDETEEKECNLLDSKGKDLSFTYYQKE